MLDSYLYYADGQLYIKLDGILRKIPNGDVYGRLFKDRWLTMASEGGSFIIRTSQTVRYGAQTGWSVKTGAVNDIAATTAYFGVDPMPNVVKSVQMLIPPAAAVTGWLMVADEGGTLNFPTSQRLRYGVDTRWLEKTTSGAVTAGVSSFGSDPAYGTRKACYLWTLPGVTQGVAGQTIGRELSLQTALAKEYGESSLYLLDEDSYGRLWRRPISDAVADALEINPDKATTRRLHHIPLGPEVQFEKRSLSDNEARQYLANYVDLSNGFGQDISRAKDHYNTYGWYENRFATPFVSTPVVDPPPAAINVLALNGVDNFVDLPDHAWFDGNFTIEAWVYPRSFNSWSRILDFGNGPGNDNVLLALSREGTGQPQLSVFRGTVQQLCLSPKALALNTWSHVAATLSGTTATIYINGEQVASGSVHQPNNVVRTINYLGRSNWTTDPYANMLLVDVRIWSVARTGDQIRAYMHQQLQGPEAGLRGYWPLDELKERIVRNLGATRLDGALNGAAPVEFDTENSEIGLAAVSLNGSNSYLEIPGNAWFDGNFTIEAWVYPRSFNSWSRILDFGNGVGNENVLLVLSREGTGKPQLSVFRGSAEQLLLSTQALALNTWSHVAATLSGTTATIYINGQQVASGTVHQPNNVVRTKNYLGRSNWSNDGYANMLLADVRIWSVARTQGQIAENMYRRLNSSESGLRGYWPLDTVHQRVLDSGPAHAHAQIKNGVKRVTQSSRVALDFPNGQNNYIDVSPEAWFDGNFTIEAWVYPRSFNSWSRILDFGNGVGNENVLLVLSREGTGKPQLSVFRGSAEQLLLSTQALALNTWSHVAATLSGTTATIYINGQQVASGTVHQPNNVVRTKNYLGRSNWTTDPYANILLSDVRIWSVARTQAEIQANKDRALTGVEPYLRAWWRLDEPRRSDFSAGARDAAFMGAVTEYCSLVLPEFLGLFPRTVALENPVVALDGQDDYIEVPHIAAFNIQRFTLEAWIKPRALLDWTGIITKGENNSPFAMQIHTRRVQLAVNWEAPTGGAPTNLTWSSTTELQEDVWQHVAVTYDGAVIRFYINGVLDSNQPAAALTLGTNTESLFIGVDLPGGDEYFQGSLSDVRIWSRALAGVEIAANMNNRLTGEEADLVGYWPLNEGVCGTAYNLKVSPPTATPLYYQNENGKVYLRMDGYLRHIDNPEVYNRLMAVDLDPNTMNRFSGTAPFPIGPALDNNSKLVRTAQSAPIYLLDKWTSDMPQVRRRVAPDVFTALEFNADRIEIDPGTAMIGPAVSLKQFDKGQLKGATWESAPARLFGPSSNRALALNGRNQFVCIPLDEPETEITHEVWIKTSDPHAAILMISKGDPVHNGGHDRHIYLTNGNVAARLYNNQAIQSSGLNLADNSWHHIAHVFGASIGGQKLFVDGRQVATGSKTTSDFNWNDTLVLGFSFDSINHCFTGQLCDLRVWGKARTAEEIAAGMRTRLKGDEPGLLGYWPLGEVQGKVAHDLSLQQHHGSLNGGNWIAGSLPVFPGYTFANQKVVIAALDEPETEITHELWFRTAAANGGLLEISKNGISNNGGHDRHIYLTNGNLAARLYNNQTIQTSGLELADNCWHHVAHVIGASVGGQKLYVDGVEAASGGKTASDFNWQDTLILGHSFDANPSYFQGEIAEVRVWKRALSADQLQRGMHSTPGQTADLLYYLPLVVRPAAPVGIRDLAPLNETGLAQKVTRETSISKDALATQANDLQESVADAELEVETPAAENALAPAKDYTPDSLKPYLSGMAGWMSALVPASMLTGLRSELVDGEAGSISANPAEVDNPRPENRRLRLSGRVNVLGRAASLEYAEFFQVQGKGGASFKFKLDQSVDFAALIPGVTLFGASLSGALMLEEPVVILTSVPVTDVEDPDDELEVNKGLNLYGKIQPATSSSKYIRLLSYLLGNDINLHVAVDMSDVVKEYILEASVEPDLTLLRGDNFRLAFSEVELAVSAKGKPIEYAFELANKLTLTLKDDDQEKELAFIGGIKVETESVTGSFTLIAEDEWKNPFGIPGLTIRSLAVQMGLTFEAPWIDNVGIHGDLRISDIDGSVSILVDINDPDQFVFAASTQRLTLIQAMAMTPATLAMYLAIPQSFRNTLNSIFNVSLEDVKINIVPTATKIGAIEFNDEGVTIIGTLNLWGWRTHLFANLDPGNGILIVRGDMDRLVLRAGNLTILSITGAFGDPAPILRIRAAPTEIPDVYISGAVSFLGISRSLLIKMNESGLAFLFEQSFGSILTTRLGFILGNDLLQAAGSINFNLNLTVNVPLIGRITLVDVGFNAGVTLQLVPSSGQFSLSVRGKFHFYGMNLTFPTLTLSTPPVDANALMTEVGNQITRNAEVIFKEMFAGIVDFAIAVAEGVVVAAATIARIAVEVFEETMEAAAEAYRVLGKTATEAAREIKSAYNATAREVGTALRYAEYGIDVVGDALEVAFDVVANEADKIANEVADGVVVAAKVVGDGIETAAVTVADGVVVAANVVADGFVTAGTGFVRVMNPTKW